MSYLAANMARPNARARNRATRSGPPQAVWFSAAKHSDHVRTSA